MNSTLGSVVPLAMFHFSRIFRINEDRDTYIYFLSLVEKKLTYFDQYPVLGHRQMEKFKMEEEE